MHKFFGLILLVFYTITVKAENYYFSTLSGDDNRTIGEAKNSSTPWKTIGKLNSFFSNLQPGDSVLFKRGEEFYGAIVVNKSGAASQPIIFSAYGTGTKPIITGLAALTGWTNFGNGIWESNACPNAGAKVNILLINGTNIPMGRYPNADAPNKGFLTYTSHTGNTSITDQKLVGTPNWTGAELIIRKDRWEFDRSPITNHSGQTITYTSQTTYIPKDGYGYYIQNDIKTLDEVGEWYYNPQNKKVYLYNGNNMPPGNIQISTVDNLVTITYYSNFIFDNLSFRGSNLNLFNLGGLQNITISNCDISFAGIDAVYGFSLSNFNIKNSTINHTNNNAIYLAYNCSNSIIQNNTIKNTGLYMGMGNAVNYNTVSGISTGGSGTNSCKNTLIQNNTVDSTGYNGISFSGDNTIIKNNVVTNFCMTKDDGGGVYTYKGATDTYNYSGCQINGNIVLNGHVCAEGALDPVNTYTWGAYMDDNSEGVSILSNTIANMPNNGIFLHNAHDMVIRNNTIYNTTGQIYLDHDNASYSSVKNIINEGNIYFSKTMAQLSLDFWTVDNDIKNYANADSNYYAAPFGEGFTFHTKINTDDALGFYRIISDWQTVSNSDANSKGSPLNYVHYKAALSKPIKMIQFNADSVTIDGIYTQNGKSAWVNGPLDGGTLKVTPTANACTLVTIPVGNVVSGNDYVLKFSSLSTSNGAIQVYLAQSEANVDFGAANKNVQITSARKENELVLHSTFSSASESIVIKMYNAVGACYFDNLAFYNATITYVNPDNYIRFEYNPTNTAKTIALDKTYIDAKNITYKNKVTLQPYGSIILMDISQSAGKFNRNPPKQGGTPVVY